MSDDKQEELEPFMANESLPSNRGHHSSSSVSTSSLMLDHISARAQQYKYERRGDIRSSDSFEEMDLEDRVAWKRQIQPLDKRARRIFLIAVCLGLLGWLAALVLFVKQGRYRVNLDRVHDPHATTTVGHGAKLTLDQVLSGVWSPTTHELQWILGPKGEDGLLLERGGLDGRDYLVVEDVRFRGDSYDIQRNHSVSLMKYGSFVVGNKHIFTYDAWPNKDHTKILILSDWQSKWRHGGTGLYWIFDVASQQAQPLDPDHQDYRIQKAIWSPSGEAVVFTRQNNLFIRHLDDRSVRQITNDGGPDLFYGIPDWVYEEEVFESDTAMWPSDDGRYIAYLRTNESKVPEFSVQYFFSRPTGQQPKAGEESYPDTRKIKYPKAGAPMSVVHLQLYDVEKDENFSVAIDGDFPDDDRLITEVVWAGETGKVLVRSTNRESYILKMVLIDADKRSGTTVRERNMLELDNGWFEIQHTTTFIPADPSNGRLYDGYIDTIVHEGFDHLGYFSPLNNSTAAILTEGTWEVVASPVAVALEQNLVYFVATKEGSTQRHIYSVDINDGVGSIKAVTDTSQIAFYGASFSKAGSFMLLSNRGPGIPWQKVLSTPSNTEDNTDIDIEKNERLAELAKQTELPIEIYQTITIDGFELNLLEKRPPHFDKNKKYPVLFFLYNGPGSQLVDRQFFVDYQSYVAASLGYIVVNLDGRGTGLLGRKVRCAVRDNLGYWEAHDQIATAKMWAAKDYVDEERIAIWGWSYGGFMTLKTLEMDAGETFHYGMAVAPVTDWHFYDSIYTERYMRTPQNNPGGYANASVSQVRDMAKNTRFLVMHGYSDDNVHFQNTLALLDKLDLAGIQNYDVHVFPDSDHSINFHNANVIVYHKLTDWLVNAFNGEWLKIQNPTPVGSLG